MYQTALGRTPNDGELKLGVDSINNEAAHPPIIAKPPVSAWQFGYGEFDESTQQLKTFDRFPHFTGNAWEGGPVLPDPKLGWAMLNASGGHPGNDVHHGVIRRWTADHDCTVSIGGEISHTPKQGDGVRARLLTSRDGLLGQWIVYNKSAETRVNDVHVKAGDTIDFLVDCGRAGSVDSDQFTWKVTITNIPTEGIAAKDAPGGIWNSVEEFTGPAAKPVAPLTPWEKLAQVLLESNEFAFVD